MSLTLDIKKKRSPVAGWIITSLLLLVVGTSGVVAVNYMTGYGPNIIASALGIPDSEDVIETVVTDLNRATHTSSPSHPKLLSINQLGIKDARVYGVDVNDRGEIATPKNIFDVGWYNESARTEDAGVMLLGAHSHGDTKDGVFSGISNLKPGTAINVVNGDNSSHSYTVRDIKKYNISELEGKSASKITESLDNATYSLHLVTSTGKWVPALQTYDQRTVIRASKD